MSEHYEVSPIIQRVVSLNCPHLKPMGLFEALTKALGWGYNYHKPQVIWYSDCNVRIDPHKVRRVRGHTSHMHPHCPPPTLSTNVQMGTYLTFYLERLKEVTKCSLVLDGLEAVHSKGNQNINRNIINIVRISTTDVHSQRDWCDDEAGRHSNPDEQSPNSKLRPNLTKRHKRSIKYNNSVKKKKLTDTQRRKTQEIEINQDYLLDDANESLPNKLELDLSCIEEVTDILTGESDEENEWEDDSDEDIHKIVRKTVTANISTLLGISTKRQPEEMETTTDQIETVNNNNILNKENISKLTVADGKIILNNNRDKNKSILKLNNGGGDVTSRSKSNNSALDNNDGVDLPTETDEGQLKVNATAGQIVVLQLCPSVQQQAWQFQSAHLMVWYRDHKITHSTSSPLPHSSVRCRKPPQRTRQTYNTPVKPKAALSTLQSTKY